MRRFRAELRRNAACTRYSSALCGLGAGGGGGVPLFPEHDLLVAVDADLDVDDVAAVNYISISSVCLLKCFNTRFPLPAISGIQYDAVNKNIKCYMLLIAKSVNFALLLTFILINK